MSDNSLNKQNDLNFSIDLESGKSSTSLETKSDTSQISEKNLKESEKNRTKQQFSSNEKIDFTNFLSKAKNPGVVFFTIFFKGLAVACFLLLGIFGVSDSLIFIFVVILNSLDFWFVKNVSGRILVGLRWWNEVKEDGSEEWKFESSHEIKEKSIDTFVFWLSLYVAPVFWGIFIFLELIGFRLMWLLACIIAFVLTFSNTFGYYKCSGEQNKKLNDFKQEGVNKIFKFGLDTFMNNNNK